MRRTASVSFAPPDPVTLGPRGRTPTRAPIAVGPGRAVTAAPDRVRAERGTGVSYPIQPGKVQAPALRDEILARTRLLDWLETKIHCRVLFVIADAGYGKTTLLADFSRRHPASHDLVPARRRRSRLGRLPVAPRRGRPRARPRLRAANGGDPAIPRTGRADPRRRHRGLPRRAEDDRAGRRRADLRRLPPCRRGRRRPAHRPRDRDARSGASLDRLREPSSAARPRRQAPGDRRACGARDRRAAVLGCRARAALPRDLWPAPRARRPDRARRADRGLGCVADARPAALRERSSRRDAVVRPWPLRRPRRAPRLPGRGGRRRSAA